MRRNISSPLFSSRFWGILFMVGFYHTKAQTEYTGPEELRIFADFLPHIGEFALSFTALERHVTWSIESFVGATRWDGNELEGMVQNFSSRIKFLDICARPKSRDGVQKEEREKLISRIRAINSFRNNLFHCATTGIAVEGDQLFLMLKRLDAKTGKETPIRIGLVELKETAASIHRTVNDLRGWTLIHCPDAEKRVA